MSIEKSIQRIEAKNAIRFVLAGWLFGKNDVEEIPKILEEMAEDYKKAIKKEMNEDV